MVADLLGTDPDDECSSPADEFAYDLPAITTAGRYWVTARPGRRRRRRSGCSSSTSSLVTAPVLPVVPPELREMAAERPLAHRGLAYRSDLGDRLPDGLTMPRALGVFDLDEESNAVWLEEVPGRRPRRGTSTATRGRPGSSVGSRPARGCASSRDVGRHD